MPLPDNPHVARPPGVRRPAPKPLGTLTRLERAVYLADLGLAVAVFALCALLAVQVVRPPSDPPVAAGEARGWGILGLAALLPLGVALLAAADAVRRRAAARWWLHALPLLAFLAPFLLLEMLAS